MRSSTVPAVAAVAVGMAACGQPVAPDPPGIPVPVVRLRTEPCPQCSFEYYSGLTEAQRLVVRDRAAWTEVWAAIWRRHSPLPALPEVDFARDMLVVAALGERPSGGYGILVDSAAATPEGLVVLIRTISPEPSCAVTLALTQPVDIARLPRHDGAVLFSDRPELGC